MHVILHSVVMTKNEDNLSLPEDFTDYKVTALPIVANFCQELGITRIVDQQVGSPENISSGQVVVGMIMDTLSGRSPLYKLHDYFVGQDMELLFGSKLVPEDFNDNNVGKVLDNIHDYGASKLFSQIAFNAAQKYDLNSKYMHYDTTSVNVHGDYAGYETETEEVIAITHGYSKDHRPDLKQFMMDSLCIEGAIPLLGAVLSGNKSDKKANNNELTRVASLMKKHKLDPMAYVYIADSALIIEDNLTKISEQEQSFLSRLPGNYKEEQRAIEAAFEANSWEDLGALAQFVDPSKKRPSARYKVCETSVELYGISYRAIVVHSSAHDKRRLKKLDRQIAEDQNTFAKQSKALTKTYFNCQTDAQRHADALIKQHSLNFHELQAQIVSDPVYQRGRPKQGQPRKIKTQRYRIEIELTANEEEIAARRERSGCFVLISNLPSDGEDAHSAGQILSAYKEQYGIEMNFRFLKDPVIVNDTFLKKAERIEALGFILLLSLLVWNLVQHLIRKHIKQRKTTILGWDKKQTTSPTTMMVFHHFQHISIFTWNQGRCRRLSRLLHDYQKDYLCAMGLPESIFITPVKTYRN